LAIAEGAMDIRMERFLVEQKQLGKVSAKILELNPNHPIIVKIKNSLGAKRQKKIILEWHIYSLIKLVLSKVNQ
jgi:molecular chaperone HtpG